jgi:L-rhamnose mutarotase
MRKAFRMSVHPGSEAEYARRHQPIWAELEAVLRAHGVREYSISWIRRRATCSATPRSTTRRAGTRSPTPDVCRRWWTSMAPLMPVASPTAARCRAT